MSAARLPYLPAQPVVSPHPPEFWRGRRPSVPARGPPALLLSTRPRLPAAKALEACQDKHEAMRSVVLQLYIDASGDESLESAPFHVLQETAQNQWTVLLQSKEEHTALQSDLADQKSELLHTRDELTEQQQVLQVQRTELDKHLAEVAQLEAERDGLERREQQLDAELQEARRRANQVELDLKASQERHARQQQRWNVGRFTLTGMTPSSSPPSSVQSTPRDHFEATSFTISDGRRSPSWSRRRITAGRCGSCCESDRLEECRNSCTVM
eukprot:gnl/TRDRNA2_/TRDRNA2_81105_c0_seq1.p1 gnl/TRDRNA2_/TRDRNA2_81105_c0~~gnl/TRDRNA2_/TRDRNA2_81105_c0_seq1.p1  ORF type:complete len:288 (-),score=39.54 gnl/TRDRNA2_/TRDRNA2_81105_c0_seq1:86-895(-)